MPEPSHAKPKVINISKRTLTQSQIRLLCKGPKFCPTSRGNFIHSKADTKDFTRKLKLRERFFNSNYTDESLVKHPSTYNVKPEDNELIKIVSTIENLEPMMNANASQNLSVDEYKAIKELNVLCETDLVIKKADKGSSLVIMDKSFYRDTLVMKDHLMTDTYVEANKDCDLKVMKDIKCLLGKHRSCLTDKEFKYVTDFTWKSSNFYVLPKIHKSKEIIEGLRKASKTYVRLPVPSDLKGRPVIAGPVAPTQHLSELLEKILAPLVPQLKSYIKDDWDFLRKFPRQLEPDCNLYSCDVSSLYTNISHDLGIRALKYWTHKLRHLIPARFTTQFILECSDFVLRNNYFMFDKKMFLQVIGTAIGTIFAPPYACLSMGFLEETKLYPELQLHFDNETCQYLIRLFLRYMDDGIVPLPKHVDFNIFKNILQSMDENIDFTFEEATETLQNGILLKTLSFLDVTVILNLDGSVETDVFYKETNSHDYLAYDSHHPQHVIDNIPFNLAKRIVVFCSDYKREQFRLKELKGWLLNCGYPEYLIDKKFHNAKLQGPAPNPEDSKNVIPLVSTYYSNIDSKHITETANSLMQNCKSDHLRSVFGNCKAIASYKQPPNLLRQLTRAEFNSTPEPILQQEKGLFKCMGNRCDLCKLNYIQECKFFETSNGSIWNVNCHINCNSKNVVYYLKCPTCVQTYTGQTNNLRLRMNGHRSGSRLGNNTNIFDRHIFQCRKKAQLESEPLFLIYAFLTVGNARMLLSYENHLHDLKYDTMN